jgi:cation diffusion facilitator family transporter
MGLRASEAVADPIPTPHDGLATGAHDKRRITAISMLASGTLAVVKLVVGLLSGSLGLLSSAIDSFMDLGATAITFMAVRAADRPADEDHPYGHGKFESVAAFVECGFLAAAGLWVAAMALRRLFAGGAEIEMSTVAIIVIVASIAVDYWRVRALRRTAAATGSQALAADALNFTADMVNSAAVLVGLGLVALGIPAADAAAALFVSLVILVAAWRLGRRTFDVLVDTAPTGVAERVRQAAATVGGVAAVEQVRVRPTGSSTFAEVLLSVDRALPLEKVVDIKDAVARKVHAIEPQMEIAITANPVQLDDESIATRVRILAANRRLAIHHLTVQHIGPRMSVSFDIEVDGAMALAEAHVLASRFENEVAAEFGGGIEVESHIEPLSPDHHDGRDAPDEQCAVIAADLSRIAAEAGGTVRDVHDIRVRANADGLVVNFHAVLDPSLTVHATHDAMDTVERRLRLAHPDIVRIVGHAEPSR